MSAELINLHPIVSELFSWGSVARDTNSEIANEKIRGAGGKPEAIKDYTDYAWDTSVKKTLEESPTIVRNHKKHE